MVVRRRTRSRPSPCGCEVSRTSFGLGWRGGVAADLDARSPVALFVLSTLHELALERAAVRQAIASLRLAPILFEQGARPHAPRDLYAAYVGQCDVFVGIYWQSYGWIANLAELRSVERRFDDAREFLVVALTACRAVRLYDAASYALEAGARIAQATGGSDDAARLLGAADGLRDEGGIPIWGPRLNRFQTLKASVGDALGEQAFGVAWTDGTDARARCVARAGRRIAALTRARVGSAGVRAGSTP